MKNFFTNIFTKREFFCDVVVVVVVVFDQKGTDIYLNVHMVTTLFSSTCTEILSNWFKEIKLDLFQDKNSYGKPLSDFC